VQHACWRSLPSSLPCPQGRGHRPVWELGRRKREDWDDTPLLLEPYENYIFITEKRESKKNKVIKDCKLKSSLFFSFLVKPSYTFLCSYAFSVLSARHKGKSSGYITSMK
jgi:hypothetical protein